MTYRQPIAASPIRAIRAASVPRWYAPGDIRAVRAIRAMSGLGATVSYPRPTRPGVWYAPGDIRAIRASRGIRAMSGLGAMAAASRGIRAVPVWYAPSDIRAIRAMRASRGGLKGLLGLLGLGTDVMTPSPDSGTLAPGQNVASAPTQMPDGSMAPTTQLVPVDTSQPVMVPVPVPTVPAPVPTTVPAPVPMPMPMSSAPKKWYSFLETTKADGTVTGPLGISWTMWIIGGGAAALFFANRNSESGGGSSEASTPNKRHRRSRRNNRMKGLTPQQIGRAKTLIARGMSKDRAYQIAAHY